jgi:hypothetical protein
VKRFTKHAQIQYRFTVVDNGAGHRVFVKLHLADAKLEFERGRFLHQLAQRTGAFRACEPLDLLESRELTVWKYLPKLLGQRDALYRSIRRGPQEKLARMRFVQRTGYTLALIHDALNATGNFPEIAPVSDLATGYPGLDQRVIDCLAASPKRPPHGDYACTNTFCSSELCEPDPTLVVIDPWPNPYLFPDQSPFVCCSVYLECALWFFSLSFHRKTHRALREELDDYLNQFTAGYAEGSGNSLDREMIVLFAALIARQHRVFFDRFGKSHDWQTWLDRRFRSRRIEQILNTAGSVGRS